MITAYFQTIPPDVSTIIMPVRGDLQLTWHYAKMRMHFTLSGAMSILFSLASRFINSSEKPFRFERPDLWQNVAVIIHERSGAVLRTGEFTRALTDVADTVTVSSQRISDTSPPERPRPSSAGPRSAAVRSSSEFPRGPSASVGRRGEGRGCEL